MKKKGKKGGKRGIERGRCNIENNKKPKENDFTSGRSGKVGGGKERGEEDAKTSLI